MSISTLHVYMFRSCINLKQLFLLSLEPVFEAVTPVEPTTPCKTPRLLKAVSVLTLNRINLVVNKECGYCVYVCFCAALRTATVVTVIFGGLAGLLILGSCYKLCNYGLNIHLMKDTK